MTGMEVVAFAIAFVLGIAVGAIVGGMITYSKNVGNLVIDDTDEDGPYMFLELEEKPEKFMKEKHVCLCVKRRGYFEDESQ